MFDTILVGTDGSDSASRAVEHALTLADHHEATLHGIFVVDTTVYGEPALGSSELFTHQIEERGSEYLDAIEQLASEQAVEFVRRCCHGNPHEEIVRYADEVEADVIVLGFQGQLHTKRQTLGSVTDRVVRLSERPALIV